MESLAVETKTPTQRRRRRAADADAAHSPPPFTQHTRPSSSTTQALETWLRDRGERAALTGANVFMWGAAAHAAYVVAVPALLRAGVAQRNATRARVRFAYPRAATGEEKESAMGRAWR